MQTIELRINARVVGEIAVINRGPAPEMGMQRNVYRYEWMVVHDSAIYGSLDQTQGFIDHARHEGPYVLAGRVIQAAVGA